MIDLPQATMQATMNVGRGNRSLGGCDGDLIKTLTTSPAASRPSIEVRW